MIMLIAEAALRALVVAVAVYALLKLFRVEDAQKKLTAWTFVLIAALAMPLLMQFRVDLPLLPAPATAIEAAASEVPPLLSTPERPPVPEPTWTAEPFSRASLLPDLSWQDAVLALYLLVAAIFLARLAFGLVKVFRLAAHAVPVTGVATHGLDVRAHADLSAPVALGHVVLVPASFIYWSAAQQRAALAHEGAHIENYDFTVQALAAFHKAIFWFSPFSWWLQKEMSELAESISDDAAIAALNDRPVYAEILLGFSRLSQEHSPAIGMARSSNIMQRIERVISETALTPEFSLRSKMLLAAALAPVLVLSAMTGLKAAEPVAVEQIDAPPAPPAPMTPPAPMAPPAPPAPPVRAALSVDKLKAIAEAQAAFDKAQIALKQAEQQMAAMEPEIQARIAEATARADRQLATAQARAQQTTDRAVANVLDRMAKLDFAQAKPLSGDVLIQAPSTIRADRIDRSPTAVTYSGDVVLVFGQRRLTADRVVFEIGTGKNARGRAEGNVVLAAPGSIMRAPWASLDVDAGQVKSLIWGLDVPRAPIIGDGTRTIYLMVDFDGSLYWDGKPVTRDELQAHFRQSVSTRANIRVTVNPQAKFGTVSALLADAKRLGVTRIGFDETN